MYLGMKCTFKLKKSTNRIGENEYTEEEVITCHRCKSFQKIKKPDGSLAYSSFKYFVNDPRTLSYDAYLDGRQVIEFEELVDVVGNKCGGMIIT